MVVPFFRSFTVLTAGTVLLAFGCNSAINEVASQPSDGQSSQAASLNIPAEALQFGPVWSSASFNWRVPFVNGSGKQQAVTSVSTSCGCVLLDDAETSFVLSPGESRPFGLKIDLRGTPAQPGHIREFQVGISASLADGEELTWNLRGLVKDAFWMANPKPIHLVHIEGDAESITPIKFLHDPAIESLSVRTDMQAVAASLREFNAGAFNIDLNSSPSGRPGMESGYLTVTGVARGTNTPVSSEWPIVVETVSELTLDPSVLHLGAINCTQSHTFQFAVKSRRNRKPGKLTFGAEEERNVAVDSVGQHRGVILKLKPIVAGRCSFDLIINEEQESGAPGKRTVVPFSAEAY